LKNNDLQGFIIILSCCFMLFHVVICPINDKKMTGSLS